MPFTLVQHSAFTANHDLRFEYAVELTSVQYPAAKRVIDVGGVLVNDYATANHLEHEANYPPEVMGLYPKVPGAFSKKRVKRSRIYIPTREQRRTWVTLSGAHPSVDPETYQQKCILDCEPGDMVRWANTSDLYLLLKKDLPGNRAHLAMGSYVKLTLLTDESRLTTTSVPPDNIVYVLVK
ncbi:MAG: hypothetical protein ACW96N_05700 [Candidatus Thorarchaeota archaeon]|jgi:hypothetical protein